MECDKTGILSISTDGEITNVINNYCCAAKREIWAMSCGPDVEELAMMTVERSRGSRQFIDHLWATRKEENVTGWKLRAGGQPLSGSICYRFRFLLEISLHRAVSWLAKSLDSLDTMTRREEKRKRRGKIEFKKKKRNRGAKEEREKRHRKQNLKLKKTKSIFIILSFPLYFLFSNLYVKLSIAKNRKKRIQREERERGNKISNTWEEEKDATEKVRRKTGRGLKKGARPMCGRLESKEKTGRGRTKKRGER